MGRKQNPLSIRSLRDKYGYTKGGELHKLITKKGLTEEQALAQYENPPDTDENDTSEIEENDFSQEIEYENENEGIEENDNHYRPQQGDRLENLLNQIETEEVEVPEVENEEVEEENEEAEGDGSDGGYEQGEESEYEESSGTSGTSGTNTGNGNSEKFEFKNEEAGEGQTKSKINADYMAGMFVTALSWVNELICPIAYENAAFTPEERASMKAMAFKFRAEAKMRKKITDAPSPSDYEILCRFEEMETYKESVPFTEEEKENLKVPLREMFKNAGVVMSPFFAFILAVAIIAFSRSAPIWFASREKKNRQRRKREGQEPPPEGDVADYTILDD